MLSQNAFKSVGALFTMVLLLASPALYAQTSSPEVTITHPSGIVGVSADNSAPLTITLQDALERARANDPSFHSALTDLGVAREDRVQSRAGLLPSVSYNNSFIYTEGSGPQPAVCAINPNSTTCTPSRFVANNGVHEYISQANVHHVLIDRVDRPREPISAGANHLLRRPFCGLRKRRAVVLIDCC